MMEARLSCNACGGALLRKTSAVLLALSMVFMFGCTAQNEADSGAASGSSDASGAADSAAEDTMTLLSGEKTVAPTAYDPASLADAGIAAVAGTTVILEADIDNALSSEREVRALADDAAWESFLAEQGRTPREYRDDVLDDLVRRSVVHQAAEQRSVAVNDEEFEESFESLKEEFGDSWDEALAAAGLTEESYRSVYRAYLDENALKEALAEDGTFGDDDVAKGFEDWYRQACDGAPVVYADADA